MLGQAIRESAYEGVRIRPKLPPNLHSKATVRKFNSTHKKLTHKSLQIPLSGYVATFIVLFPAEGRVDNIINPTQLDQASCFDWRYE